MEAPEYRFLSGVVFHFSSNQENKTRTVLQQQIIYIIIHSKYFSVSDCLKSLPCKIHYNQLLSTNGLRPHRITPWLLDFHHSFNDTQPHSIIVKYQQSVSEDTKIWTRGGHDLVLPSHQIKNKETPAVVTYKDRPASDHKAALFNEFFSSGHYTVLVK